MPGGTGSFLDKTLRGGIWFPDLVGRGPTVSLGCGTCPPTKPPTPDCCTGMNRDGPDLLGRAGGELVPIDIEDVGDGSVSVGAFDEVAEGPGVGGLAEVPP